ncbi:MAG: hypothetical protein ACLPY1_03570 [Terracidiphilus sp.]
MGIALSTIEEALREADIESLIEIGAPDDEYTSEARDIANAVSHIDESRLAEGQLLDVLRSVWARSFDLAQEDVERRAPAFQQVARRILGDRS